MKSNTTNEKMSGIEYRMGAANKKVEQLKIELADMEAGKFKKVATFMSEILPFKNDFTTMVEFFKDLEERHGNREFEYEDFNEISFFKDIDPDKKEQARIIRYTKGEIARYEKMIEVCAKEMEDLLNPIPTDEEIEKVMAYLNLKK